MQDKISVRQISTDNELALAGKMRQQIFVHEQGIPAELEDDGLNEEAIHVLLTVDRQAAGTARMVISGNNEAEIARVAIISEFRGRGYGKLLVEELEKIASDLGLKRVFLHPHHYLEKFYEDIGYTLVVGETSSAGEHLLLTMEKKLL